MFLFIYIYCIQFAPDTEKHQNIWIYVYSFEGSLFHTPSYHLSLSFGLLITCKQRHKTISSMNKPRHNSVGSRISQNKVKKIRNQILKNKKNEET